MAEKEITELQKLLLGLETEDKGKIDFKALALRSARSWHLFVLGVVLALGLGFFYLKYTSPVYTVKSKILIKDEEKGASLLSGGDLEGLDIFSGTKNIDNEIEVLNSISLMERVLTELSLNTTYYTPVFFKDREIYGKQLPIKVIIDKVDSTAFETDVTVFIKENNRFELVTEDEEGSVERSEHEFGKKVVKPFGTFTVLALPKITDPESPKEIHVKFNDIHELAEQYIERITIEAVNKKASVLWLSLETPVRDKGRDIINKLVEVYNIEALEDKNEVASNTIQFIDERLTFLTTELSNVEKDVENYKKQNQLTDVSSDAKLYIENASEYNKQLGELEIQLDVLSSIEKYLRENGSQYKLVPSTLSIQDATLMSLIGRFNSLQLERERLVSTTQANSMLVQNIEDQLANLRSNILENLHNIKRGLTITRSNLRGNMTAFKSRIEQIPAIERELLEIKRQQGIKEGLYLYLLQKREESSLSLAAAVSHTRIIDSAMVSKKPVSPKKGIVLGIAFLAGLIIPFIGIYISYLLDDKVKLRKDVEDATDTPIIGELGHNDSDETLIVSKGNRSPVAELFSLVRSNLQFSTMGRENKVVLVTSSMSGEGKTFFSINLSASLSMTGKKVVILGLDLRKPRLMHDLNLPTEFGITNYLVSEKVTIDEITVPIEGYPGLFVIGSGPIPPNPVELMTSPKLGYLIEELKSAYDYVILDTAPVGQVADTFNLAPYIDSTIYVVRCGYTLKEQLIIIDDIYRNMKLKSPMVVLNDAVTSNVKGYGYGYGNGYEQVGQKKRKSKVLA
ncbi:polysaccharide biosynthesis tyrosine autokinase [Pontibacter sp. Tf4]|uniref:GumC family protein n=1 Tax=Pontibacter sp. Tf4 TaxID=2761620 RepID=UPI0016278744|nr:polysaccharide biosynthesis tyrosine autokinase [Pontibacter sp. Tf4]MBB6611200.1 polysaccharide biosynthesis tyrosine autokinase [Pontibacter sp. Tf4]